MEIIFIAKSKVAGVIQENPKIEFHPDETRVFFKNYRPADRDYFILEKGEVTLTFNPYSV